MIVYLLTLLILSAPKPGAARTTHHSSLITDHSAVRLPPSWHAKQTMLADPDDPYWDAFWVYADEAPTYPLGWLFGDFVERSSDDPADVLTRHEIATEVSHRTNPQSPDYDPRAKRVARTMLMEMLAMERDAGVRLRTLSALWESCEIGDIEVADFLDDLLESEADPLVRPLMRTVIHCLRTGEGPCGD